MKKFPIMVMLVLSPPVLAEPQTFTLPDDSPRPVTVGEMLNIPPAEGRPFPTMSLACFHYLNPDLSGLELDDVLPTGEVLTYDLSCQLKDG